MRAARTIFGVSLTVVVLAVNLFAAPFVLFPKAGELASPDRRYVVRSVEQRGSGAEFSGTFRALWLTEVATGRSRKLCDYLGVAAVSWSSDDFLVITEYVGKKTSRALVFAAASADPPVTLDVPTLIWMVAPERRAELRENDHVFVEASRLEGDTLHLRVWGYGRHDLKGFRWSCEYSLNNGGVFCAQPDGSTPAGTVRP